MHKIVLCILFVFSFVSSLNAESLNKIPNAELLITVQQKIMGNIVKAGYHLIELSCLNNNCSLSTVSLNECVDLEDKNFFYPKVQFSSTWMGNLTVRNDGDRLIVQEIGADFLEAYTKTLQFDYASVGKDNTVRKLIGFSGAVVKNPRGGVYTIEYIPLKDATISRLDCDVLLPGLEGK